MESLLCYNVGRCSIKWTETVRDRLRAGREKYCRDLSAERQLRAAARAVPGCRRCSVASMRRARRSGQRRHALRRPPARRKRDIICARPGSGQGRGGGVAGGAGGGLFVRAGRAERDRRPGAARSGRGGGRDAGRARGARGRVRWAPRHRPEHHRSGHRAACARRGRAQGPRLCRGADERRGAGGRRRGGRAGRDRDVHGRRGCSRRSSGRVRCLRCSGAA